MEPEARLARFVCELQAADVPGDAARIMRLVLMTTGGTAVAGAAQDGVAALRDLLLKRGGTAEASSLVFGDRLPAASAALFNGVMCRALDYCDAMLPGLHIGSSLIPAAFAAAELAGGCSGANFLAAISAGAELASRFNLTEAQYDGFDPTGIAAIFGSTAASARILGLTPLQTQHALGLAFNRCGGSFQSNVDGSLAVRMIQGWVAEAGINCAQLARAGITGPTRFLTGVYGFCHLFTRGALTPASVVEDLGSSWRLKAMVFKKYPSCGGTQAMTELALSMVTTLDLTAQRLRSVQVRVRPYTYKLVGHPFQIGDNPRVDAQFSAQYCVASAIVRRSSELPHFEPTAIRDPRVLEFIKRVTVVSDDRLSQPNQPVAVLVAETIDGNVHERSLAFAPGFPGNELSDSQHLARFHDCMKHAPYPLSAVQITNFLGTINQLEGLADARALLAYLHSPISGS
jgi:2-methylcitrate dehydratase PrpD